MQVSFINKKKKKKEKEPLGLHNFPPQMPVNRICFFRAAKKLLSLRETVPLYADSSK